MKDQLQSKVSALLDYVGSRTQSAEGFLLEQAPLVAQEILRWELWTGIVGVVLGLVILAAGAFFAWKFWKLFKSTNSRSDRDMKEIWGMLYAVLGGSGLLLGTIVTGFNAQKAAKTILAPRIVILEYVKQNGK